jgi:hypothetical protein
VTKYNIGFILIHIDNNAYYDHIFKQIKKLIDSSPYSNICIFTSNCDKTETYNIPILHLAHAKFFNGVLWLFDIPGVLLSKNFCNTQNKILYANDMPWTKEKNNSFLEWKNIYSNELDFVVTDQYLYDIYNICWKKPLSTMEEFNYEKIQLILRPTF